MSPLKKKKKKNLTTCAPVWGKINLLIPSFSIFHISPFTWLFTQPPCIQTRTQKSKSPILETLGDMNSADYRQCWHNRGHSEWAKSQNANTGLELTASRQHILKILLLAGNWQRKPSPSLPFVRAFNTRWKEEIFGRIIWWQDVNLFLDWRVVVVKSSGPPFIWECHWCSKKC